MKDCVACAEEIKANAKLCKHCGTLQSDSQFAVVEDSESSHIDMQRERIRAWFEATTKAFVSATGFDEADFIEVDDADSSEILKAGKSRVWTLSFSYDFTTQLIHEENTASGYGYWWTPGYEEPGEDTEGYFISKFNTKDMKRGYPWTFVTDCGACGDKSEAELTSKPPCGYCGATGTWEFTT